MTGLALVVHDGSPLAPHDLWRAWVARPTDLPLLDARLEARERLREVQARTDGWRLPRPIREAMRAWVASARGRETAERKSLRAMLTHWRTGELLVKRLGRYERYTDDCVELLGRAPRGHLNGCPSIFAAPYRDLYDAPLLAAVSKFTDPDAERFGYVW